MENLIRPYRSAFVERLRLGAAPAENASGAAAPALPPERAALSRWIERAAMFFGVACFLDALREAFSFTGEPGVHPEIYVVYGVVLGGYSVAREWEKWVAPGAQDAPRYGHLFVPAWLGLAALVWLLDFIGWERRPYWPSHLTLTLANVVAFSFGTRLSGSLRRWGWGTAVLGELGGRAASGRVPRPAPDCPLPPVDVPAEGGEGDSGNSGQFQRTEAYWRAHEAAQRLGTFTSAGLREATGFTPHSVRYHIRTMLKEGLIVREGLGHYKWTGGAKDAAPSPSPLP